MRERDCWLGEQDRGELGNSVDVGIDRYSSERTGRLAVADRVTVSRICRCSFRPNAGARPSRIRPEQRVKLEAVGKHRHPGGDHRDEPARLDLVVSCGFEGVQMAATRPRFVDDAGSL